MLLGEANETVVSLLEGNGFSRIMNPEINEDFRTRFLKEYVDLVGALGRECSSRMWWATDIASKNRFTSRLSFLLYQFFIAAETANKKDYDYLIILNPPWVIISSLTAMLEERKLDFVCYGSNRDKILSVGSSWFKRIPILFYVIFKKTYQLYYSKKKLSQALKRSINHDTDYYVIKTFIYNHSFSADGDYRDAFFGALIDFLKEKKKNVLIYAVIAGNYKQCIENIKKCQSPVVIPIEFYLSLSDILNAAYQLLFRRIKITRDVHFFGYKVKDIINNELFQSLKGIQYYHLLHYWSAKRLLTNVSAETFLMTCENNPWEKMCIMAAREHSPTTTIIGYQHAVVPQASANMFNTLQDREQAPSLDKILTVGEAPKKIMERYGHYENGKIEAACGLRFEYLFDVPLSKRRRSNTILLALEGIPEVYKMVNYVFKELHKSSYTLIIRTHPVLPLEKISHKLSEEFGSSQNFRISKQRSLKQDIEEGDIVMYWGSTVGLEALSMGKPVIHFEMGSVLSYDPLFECKHLKWTVSESNALQKTLDEIYSLSDHDFDTQQTNARLYIQSYFNRITKDNLQKFLS